MMMRPTSLLSTRAGAAAFPAKWMLAEWCAAAATVGSSNIGRAEAGPDELIKVPNYRLVGVREVAYDSVVLHEERFNDGKEYRCKLDRSRWKAVMSNLALAATANTKLMLSPEPEPELPLIKNIRDRGKPKTNDEVLRDAAQARRPHLSFSVTSVEAGDICVATVRGKVWPLVRGSVEFIATDQSALVKGADMWSGSAWIRVHGKDITDSVIDVTKDLVKDFLDQWKAASCLGSKDLRCQ